MPSAPDRLPAGNDTSDGTEAGSPGQARPHPDPGFQRAIVEQGPMLQRQAARLTRDASDAADLVQDTLERALRKAPGFRPGSNLRAWLLTIMTNLFIDRCRRENREGYAEPADQERLPAPVAETVPPWAELTQAEVRQALDQLTPAFREPYVLCALEHLSYQAVAVRLQIPVATVGTRMSRARQRLRALLEQQLGKRSS